MALALALLAAGCGTSDSDVVKQTVKRALTDVARGDGQAFCALATPAERAHLGRLVPGYDCAQLMHFIGVHLLPATRRAMLHAQVSRVQVHGDVARVYASAIDTTQGSLSGVLDDDGVATRLVRQGDGTWRVAG